MSPTQIIGLAPGVMAHWYDPSGTLRPQKGPGIKPSGGRGETPAEPLPMSLTWGCQQLVRLGLLLLCF
jgi:hypothetical protein